MSAAPERDYYEVLGVARDASGKQIKDAYHRLAMRYHPDRNKAADAEERFKEIAKAYAVLRDPKKRAEYDAKGHAGVAHFTHEDLFGGLDFGDMFDGLDLGGGLFGRMFGRRPRAAPARGQDIHVELVVPLERVAKGGEELVRFRRLAPCPSCHGTGASAGAAPQRCGACGGSGHEVLSRRDQGITFQQVRSCPVCRGSGGIIGDPCTRCAGRGAQEREDAVNVTIPAGVQEGMMLRVAGHGTPGASPGVSPGDLLVVVRTRPDPRFERRGPHLWHGVSVSVADAALGARVRVPTLEGSARLEIPPGTQPHTVLRMAGKGLPALGGDARGDINVRVTVEIPKTLAPEERELYERLRRLQHAGRA